MGKLTGVLLLRPPKQKAPKIGQFELFPIAKQDDQGSSQVKLKY